MKIGTMFSDVARSFFQRPITEKYPFTRPETPWSLRGCLMWDPVECTGCGMCARDCPANALEMVVIDKKAKRFVLIYHLDRCTFCAQCVYTCMKNSISMQNDAWELAALDRSSFTIYYGKKEDVEQVLAGGT